jgi:glycosyltransferase involved in cell wall biosynthesis
VKILLVVSNYPYAQGEAVEVVVHEVIRLIAESGHEISVQVILPRGKSYSSELESRAKETLKSNRIQWLRAIELGQLRPASLIPKGLRKLGMYLRHMLRLPTKPSPLLFPSMAAAPLIQQVVNEEGHDAILSIWSWEALPAVYALIGAKKFIYYGNPNHKPAEARLSHPEMWGDDIRSMRARRKRAMQRLKNRIMEDQHLHMMNRCEVEANNSLHDAKYYETQGHPRSLYLQNMWPEADCPPSCSHTVSQNPIRIAASVGNLKATGNTMAFHYLGKEILPRLIRLFGEREFILDVYGKGPAHPPAGQFLSDSHFRLHGWVDDLNAELVDSSCFLCLTNAYDFIVGNTRVLLAWSLGVPVVAHSNSVLSMPEIIHDESALLGSDPDEVAHSIHQVCMDDDLRKRIGQGGLSAYEKFYRSTTVVPKMVSLIEQMISEDKNTDLTECQRA